MQQVRLEAAVLWETERNATYSQRQIERREFQTPPRTARCIHFPTLLASGAYWRLLAIQGVVAANY
jgi:hypothetical protein